MTKLIDNAEVTALNDFTLTGIHQLVPASAKLM